MVSIEEYSQLQSEMAKKDELIASLQNEIVFRSTHAEVMERKATLANKIARAKDQLLRECEDLLSVAHKNLYFEGSEKYEERIGAMLKKLRGGKK